MGGGVYSSIFQPVLCSFFTLNSQYSSHVDAFRVYLETKLTELTKKLWFKSFLSLQGSRFNPRFIVSFSAVSIIQFDLPIIMKTRITH